MNKKTFFYGLLAAMTLAGCSSSDDVAVEGSNATISDGNPHYVTVNIVDVGSASTRADFVDGSTEENKVSSVRFYFFNEDGTPALVKKAANGNYVNYLDWEPSDEEKKEEETSTGGENVEKKLAAKLVINTKEGDKLPTKMLALVNYTPTSSSDAIFGEDYNKSLNLTTLRGLTGNFKNLADNGTFVMANSVYAKDNEHVSTTTIPKESMKATDIEALANPVDVYVERNVAKVSVGYKDGLFESDGMIKVLDKEKSGEQLKITIQRDSENDKEAISGEQTVYFKVLSDEQSSMPGGWGLAATTNKVYLSKHINSTWSFDNWGENANANKAWNDNANFRSYWAYNVQGTTSSGTGTSTDIEPDEIAGKDYDKYGEYINPIGKTTIIYANEDAAKNIDGYDRTYPTQVVVAGTLCNASGEALTFGDYQGSFYTEEALLKALYNQLNLYSTTETTELSTGSTTQKQCKKIDSESLELISAAEGVTRRNEAKGDGEEKEPLLESQRSPARCTVELGLKENASYDNLCTDNVYSENKASVTKAEVLKALKEAGTALLYKDGKTYYWFKIPHLAKKDKGEFGVVRNHWYNCTINSIVGLGTPTHGDEEVIYPETPIDVNTYISAKINILSWKKVDSDINLGQ